MNIEGITSIFYGTDFITVTKAADADWAHVKPEVFSLITEAINSGEQIVKTIEDDSNTLGQNGCSRDTLAYQDDDNEVVRLIKELLETRIRPAIQEDGGDVEFRGFSDGNVLLKLRGACRTCDSSTVTLKNGIESMLMHYVSWSQRFEDKNSPADAIFVQIEEVNRVTQVQDHEEEIATKEFAKLEKKLKEQQNLLSSASKTR